VFLSVADELHLECSPSSYTISLDSYDSEKYRVTHCKGKGQYTDIQLAVSDDHVAVEVYQISGSVEPPLFRQCRSALAAKLSQSFGPGRVTVRYPYRRDRAAQLGQPPTSAKPARGDAGS